MRPGTRPSALYNSVVKTKWTVVVVVVSASFLSACTPKRDDTPVATQPAATQTGSDPLETDNAAGLAGEDASRFNAKPAKRAPARRPPEVRQNRPVDQPRVRP